MLEMHMKREEHGHKMQLATHQAKLAEVQAGTQIALAGHQVEQDKHKADTEKAKASQPKEPSGGGTTIIAGDKGAQSVTDGFTGGFKQLADQHMQSHKQTMEALGSLVKHASAPRKIVRGKDGKISHVETAH